MGHCAFNSVCLVPVNCTFRAIFPACAPRVRKIQTQAAQLDKKQILDAFVLFLGLCASTGRLPFPVLAPSDPSCAVLSAHRRPRCCLGRYSGAATVGFRRGSSSLLPQGPETGKPNLSKKGPCAIFFHFFVPYASKLYSSGPWAQLCTARMKYTNTGGVSRGK